ncbi:immunoglobulin-like domain-containing protein [Anaerolentibacter hominis]|uniref:immunoglobulin-like domain-containing protein n=1 Tax=Anaerolentibacter hominis TaxID=3079009 RepID=UPI0031B86623
MKKLLLPILFVFIVLVVFLIYRQGTFLPVFQNRLEAKMDSYHKAQPLDLTMPLQENGFVRSPLIRKVISRELAFGDVAFDPEAKRYYMEYKSLGKEAYTWLKQNLLPFPWIELRENADLVQDYDLQRQDWMNADHDPGQQLAARLKEYAFSHPDTIYVSWTGNILIDRDKEDLIELLPHDSVYRKRFGILDMKAARLTKEKEKWLTENLIDSDNICWENSIPVRDKDELEEERTARKGISNRYVLPEPSGFYMELSSYQEYKNHSAILVTLYNETDQPVSCFVNITLECEIDGTWYDVVTKEPIYYENGWFRYPIEPGESVCCIIDPKRRGYVMEPGKYRVSQVIFTNDEEDLEGTAIGRISREFQIE